MFCSSLTDVQYEAYLLLTASIEFGSLRLFCFDVEKSVGKKCEEDDFYGAKRKQGIDSEHTYVHTLLVHFVRPLTIFVLQKAFFCISRHFLFGTQSVRRCVLMRFSTRQLEKSNKQFLFLIHASWQYDIMTFQTHNKVTDSILLENSVVGECTRIVWLRCISICFVSDKFWHENRYAICPKDIVTIEEADG